jgi:hypothetical protein
VKNLDAACALAASAERRFDGDTARLAMRALAGKSAWPLDVVVLDPIDSAAKPLAAAA